MHLLPFPGSPPFFPIIIESNGEDAFMQSGRENVLSISFPNLDEISSEAFNSLNELVDDVFYHIILYEKAKLTMTN